MKRFFKTMICLTLMTSLFFPVTAFAKGNKTVNNANEFINETESMGMDVKIVESVPENVIPKKFKTWEEAYDWIDQINNEINDQNNRSYLTSSSFYNILNDGFVPAGEKGSVQYTPMPSGSGSLGETNSYSVPGLSAQTVIANYYFNYSNNKITSSSASAHITGIGFATFAVTYNELQEWGAFFEPNYYRVIRGNLGYFINVGGQSIGVYDYLELDYCIWNSSYPIV